MFCIKKTLRKFVACLLDGYNLSSAKAVSAGVQPWEGLLLPKSPLSWTHTVIPSQVKVAWFADWDLEDFSTFFNVSLMPFYIKLSALSKTFK